MSILTVFVAFIGILLMIAVLIQNPKGGGVDSTFGGAQANQMFGAAKSSDFIEKATWGLAIALILLSVLMAPKSSMIRTSDEEGGSIAKKKTQSAVAIPQQQTAPVQQTPAKQP